MRYRMMVLGLVVGASPLAAQGNPIQPTERAEQYERARAQDLYQETLRSQGTTGPIRLRAKWSKLTDGIVDSPSFRDAVLKRREMVELPPVSMQIRYADEGKLLRIYSALLDQTYAIDGVAGTRMTSEARQIFADLRERQPTATVKAWMLALQPAIDDALDARTKWMTRALSPVVRATVIAKMEAMTRDEYDAKYPALLATLYRAWSADPEAPAGSADSAVLAGLANNDN